LGFHFLVLINKIISFIYLNFLCVNFEVVVVVVFNGFL